MAQYKALLRLIGYEGYSFSVIDRSRKGMLQNFLVNIIRLRKRKSEANNKNIMFEIKPLRGQLVKCERETIRRL